VRAVGDGSPMKILFVRPQREARGIALSLPPLGVMYLASYLRERLGDRVDVRILDLTLVRNGRQAMNDALSGFSPDIVGLSALTPEAGDLAYFARFFKRRFPETIVLAGGPHPNAAPEHALAMSGIDAISLGEGERTMLDLVQRLDRGDDWRAAPGLAYLDDEYVVRNELPAQIEDLDTIPFPAWDRVDLLGYCSWRVVNPSVSRHYRRFTTIFTSRSCPFGCTYCHQIFGHGYRARSAENIVAEMEALESRYGIREFHIVDDVFNLKRDRVIDVCDRIKGRGYKLAFVSGLRGDILTPELIDKLYEAGTYQISFGIESASERIQKLVCRNNNLPKLIENIEHARKIGMITHGFFMFGFPDETREEVDATAKLAMQAKLVTAAFHTVAPYPGTPLFDLLKERAGDNEIRMEEMFFKSSTMNLSSVPTAELHGIVKQLFRRFYLTKGRLSTIWRMAPRKIDVIISMVFHLLLDPRLLRVKQWLTGKTHY
jgi:radical SAM superfamily enzyme YgiQ (UPF0313 family)